MISINLSEGIIPPPPLPTWTFVTDDDDDPPPGIIDPGAGQPPSSLASKAANRAVEEAIVIRSSTSTARLADVSVTASDGAEDLAGLLHPWAAVLLGMVEANAVNAASCCPPPPPGEVKLWPSLSPAGSAGIR